jgi:diguanylate cyclase (GGDEF)-like protein
MAASDPHTRPDRPLSDAADALAPAELRERLREEISRAERQRTDLSCLLVAFENLDEIAREHGEQLREQTIEYVASTLRRELRCFDRVARGSARHLVVILPGADSARGEIVARRALQRLRSIKVEADGRRLALEVSVGLAAWREDVAAHELLAHAQAALAGSSGNSNAAAAAAPVGASPPPAGREAPPASPTTIARPAEH